MKASVGPLPCGARTRSGEMIECTRERRQAMSLLVADLEARLRPHLADRRQRQTQRQRERCDALAHHGRRRKAQFVVVAAREQARQRELALVARELCAQCLAALNCTEI